MASRCIIDHFNGSINGLKIRLRRPGEVTTTNCVDSALLRKDIEQVMQLLQMGRLREVRTALRLSDYIVDKVGNDAYSLALSVLVKEGVYEICAKFVGHVICEFDLPYAMEVLKGIEDSPRRITGQGKILHYAAGRMNIGLYTLTMRLLHRMDSAAGDGRVNVNAKDEIGQTPIFYFIKADACEPTWAIYEDLLSRKADINVVDTYGDTPLLLAIKLHKTEIVNKLLKAQGLELKQCESIDLPFHIYCGESELDMNTFKLFLGSLRLNEGFSEAQSGDGRTLIHCLLYNRIYRNTGREFELVNFIDKILISDQRKSMLAIQDKAGDNPLLTAIKRCCPYEIVRKLVPSSEFINLRDNTGFTALAHLLYRFDGRDDDGLRLLIDQLIELGATKNLLQSVCQLDTNETLLCLLPDNKFLSNKIVEYFIRKLKIYPTSQEIYASYRKFRLDLTYVYLKVCAEDEEARKVASHEPVLIILLVNAINSQRSLYVPEDTLFFLPSTRHIFGLNKNFLKPIFDVIVEKFDFDLNVRHENTTVLHRLIDINEFMPTISIIKRLLTTKQIRLDIAIDDIGSPLLYCLQLGEFQIAEVLVDHGANIDPSDLTKISPKCGMIKILIALDNAGCRVPADFFETLATKKMDERARCELSLFVSWLEDRKGLVRSVKTAANIPHHKLNFTN